MSKNLLLEIGTEEMPANMMSGIVEQMHVLAGAKLDEARIAFEKVDQDRSRYDRGVDVLKDIYTLARCGGLIAGLSQVSIMARIICLSLEREYRYVKILNTGIYKK